MKHETRPSPALRVVKQGTLRHEAARLADRTLTAVQQNEPTNDQPTRPERSAAEQTKELAVTGVQTAALTGAQGAKNLYLHGKLLRERVMQKRAIPQGEPESLEEPIPSAANPPASPAKASATPAGVSVDPTTPQSQPMLSTASRKDAIRRQLYAKRAVKLRAEKEALYHSTQTAADTLSLPTKRRLETRRQIFLRHAARQKFLERAGDSPKLFPSRVLSARPTSPRTYSFSAIRSRLNTGFRQAVQKLAAALGRVARAALRFLTALLGAGGIVLLLVMVIGAVAAIIGSPMGILFADETGDPNAIPIAGIVQEVNADFGQAINDIVAAHPECDEVDIQYHYEQGRTWASYWPEVLAVFAVHTNLGEDGNVVVIDAANAQRIRDTFWQMHTIREWVETIIVGPEEPENEAESGEATEDMEADAEESEPEYRYILHISVDGKTADEMATQYHFSRDQKYILHQLLSDEMRPLLVSLCGSGIAGGIAGNPGMTGTLLWPLPGITNITCRFGEPDAIRGQPHKGIDIAAPEGTPILAAHDGVVLISGWNDSYGNQVLLDSGAGISTRYAHIIETAVQAGEAVTAGQVIGYVGSTGDSTGDHLHFEVMVNGIRDNPLDSFQTLNV